MANRHSTNGRIPAVACYRMSSDRQEASIPEQRDAVTRYASDNGYHILREYVDKAVSGDATEKRDDFQRMIREATEIGDFKAVLAWDMDRFGRFDSIEAGYWVHPLRQAGVHLATVGQGKIDWNDFAGRMLYGIQQEGKHQFLRDLSRNTTRGLIHAAMEKSVSGGPILYGYDRMLTDSDGNPRQRVRRGERFPKPRDWSSTLVLSEDTEQVETVRWLFETYTAHNCGLRRLTNELNGRGVPSPAGGMWSPGTVCKILRNEVYAGDFVWPKRRGGKYYHARGTKVEQRDPAEVSGKVKTQVNAETEQIVKRDVFPAIVDRKLFELVQRKLEKRRTSTSSHKQTNGDRYVLSGKLFCGNCGGKMHGTATTRRKSGKPYVYPRYICSTYQRHGSSQCGCHRVAQDTMASFLLRKLRDTVLVGKHQDELRKRLTERLKARHEADPKQEQRLQKKVAELDKSIQHGTRRLLRAPDDIADLLGNELSEMRRQRDRLVTELSDMDQHQPADIEGEVEAAVNRLWTLADDLDQAEPSKLRELFDRMVKRIDLWFERVPQGKRFIHELVRGTIELYPDPVMCGLVNQTVLL